VIGLPKDIHKAKAPQRVSFVLITVSTSRFIQSQRGKKVEDLSGDIMENIVKKSNYKILSRHLIPDSEEYIVKILEKYAGNVDVILFSGGTGISKSDITPDVVSKYAEKEIPGFGELFRYLSFREIGLAAMLSRASAYIVKGTLVFCLPGSPHAVKLALEKLILPEISHIVYHLRESSC